MKRLLLLLAACSSGAAPPAAAPVAQWKGSLAPPPAEGAEIVATVDGDAIYVADVERQARAASQTPEQALAELVDSAVLAREALRRGLADDPEVADARRRAGVRVLLARGFEPTFADPSAIADEEVAAIYRLPKMQAYYDHEEYHTCAWVRVVVAKGASPMEDANARVQAEQIHDLAVAAHPTTKKAFFAAVRAAGFPAPENQEYSTTRDHGPAVPEFAAAAFSVSTIGEIAKPVRTEWGWDVLFLSGVIPERRATRAEAYADIRKNRFEAERQVAFQRWAGGLEASHQIVKNDQHLDAVQVDSLVGTP